MMVFVFFFKQKTAYEMRISDWSSDVCSSDLSIHPGNGPCPASWRTPGARPVEPRSQHGLRSDAVAGSGGEIGRASCRERVCQYGSISVVAASLKKKIHLMIEFTSLPVLLT